LLKRRLLFMLNQLESMILEDLLMEEMP